MPEPGVPIKAAVCFCHGYGDTCTFFFEGLSWYLYSRTIILNCISSICMVRGFLGLKIKEIHHMIWFGELEFSGIARRIAGSGYAVYAMDYPGFGLSEGLHGYIPNFDYLVDDVIEHYRKIKGMMF